MAGQNLTSYWYYLYLMAHCGLQPYHQICFLACQIESAIPEKELFISQSPNANGDDDICGDHSEVSHFSSVTRYQRF